MSKSASWERRSLIRRGLPIVVAVDQKTTGSDGKEVIDTVPLKFYPITMEHYEEYLTLRGVWATRLSTLPVQYLSFPFLSALWALEYDTIMQTGKPVGFFFRILQMLYLTLRLEYNAEFAINHIGTKQDDLRSLQFIELPLQHSNGQFVQITPRFFNTQIRPLVAEQNGFDLPDESYNNDIVKAEEELAADNADKLDIDTDTLISSVAYASGLDEAELDTWTVIKFERRRRAIERDKYFTLYMQAQMSGLVKFPKGNPYPSWCYNKKQGISVALRSASDTSKNFQALGDIEATVRSGLQQAQQPQQTAANATNTQGNSGKQT